MLIYCKSKGGTNLRPKPKSDIDDYEERYGKGTVVRGDNVSYEFWEFIMMSILQLGLIGLPFYALYRGIFG
jgi:hypothetical protein